MKITLTFCFCLLLTACASGNAQHYLNLYGIKEPSAEKFTHCFNYGCQTRVDVALPENTHSALAQLFKIPTKNAKDERDKIAKAIQIFEKDIGKIIGTKNDKRGTFRLYQDDDISAKGSVAKINVRVHFLLKSYFYLIQDIPMISFAGRHYPPFIILQCVRWYVSYALSYRNIEEMMGERGFEIDHATLNRWVLHFAPLLEQRSRKYKRPVHGSWRMDETYIKIKGKWHYLYRAVDKFGKTVEFMLTKKRDSAAAKKFFRKAIVSNGLPHRVNIDKSGANKAALEHFNRPGFITRERNFELLQVKYLNNIVEQDHRHIKRITRPMGGFRKMHTAARTLAGIELMNMIKKKQLKFTKYVDQNLTPAEQFYRLASV